jgi:hypothetical protein
MCDENPFSLFSPGLSLRSNPGLELANAFGVIVLQQQSPNQRAPVRARFTQELSSKPLSRAGV